MEAEQERAHPSSELLSLALYDSDGGKDAWGKTLHAAAPDDSPLFWFFNLLHSSRWSQESGEALWQQLPWCTSIWSLVHLLKGELVGALKGKPNIYYDVQTRGSNSFLHPTVSYTLLQGGDPCTLEFPTLRVKEEVGIFSRFANPYKDLCGFGVCSRW